MVFISNQSEGFCDTASEIIKSDRCKLELWYYQYGKKNPCNNKKSHYYGQRCHKIENKAQFADKIMEERQSAITV